MTPIDPVQTDQNEQRKSMAPPYVDENPNRALVEQGMDTAENEKRDAVIDIYETRALTSEDPSRALDDIEYGSNEGAAIPAEVAAMHEKKIPE